MGKSFGTQENFKRFLNILSGEISITGLTDKSPNSKSCFKRELGFSGYFLSLLLFILLHAILRKYFCQSNHNLIEKAKTACETSNNDVAAHFVDINKMVHAGVATKSVRNCFKIIYTLGLMI